MDGEDKPDQSKWPQYLQDATESTCRLDLRIHTNGVQLSEALCDLFARHQAKVGISLDGDRAANDRHRYGRSSYDKVIAAVGPLRQPRFWHLYGGLLRTIYTANDPLTRSAASAMEPTSSLPPSTAWLRCAIPKTPKAWYCCTRRPSGMLFISYKDFIANRSSRVIAWARGWGEVTEHG